ncbi:hypothetical protein Ddc_00131 [Ditylenchus destructor]|nr:hypothetical protein Ddc_00131 [Ditylenchus destructor]
MYFTKLLLLSLSTTIKLPHIHCALDDDFKTLSDEQKNAIYGLIESRIEFSSTKNKGQYGYSHTLVSQTKPPKPLAVALDRMNEAHAKTHCNAEYNARKTFTFCLEQSKPRAKSGDNRDHKHLKCYVARLYFNYLLAKLAQLLYPENVNSHINRIPRAIETFVEKETKEFNQLWRAQQESSVNLDELLRVLNSKVEEDVDIVQETGDAEVRCLGSIAGMPPPKK